MIALSEQIIAREKLTTLMVTHSMQQAASLGDRLVMMHRGRVMHDDAGADKRRLRPDDPAIVGGLAPLAARLLPGMFPGG